MCRFSHFLRAKPIHSQILPLFRDKVPMKHSFAEMKRQEKENIYVYVCVSVCVCVCVGDIYVNV